MIGGFTIWWSLQQEPVTSTPFRGEEAGPAESAPEEEIAPADGEVLAAAPARLTWQAAPGTTYTVEIYDAESLPVWTSPRLTGGSVDLPEDVRSRFQPGEEYYWRVKGNKDGQRTESALHQFHLQP